MTAQTPVRTRLAARRARSHHRPDATRALTRPLLVLALVVGLWCGLQAAGGGFVDLAVYRFGGQAVLDDGRLYAEGTPGSGLPFTYPPFAALLMAPLAIVPFPLLVGAWTAASVLALGYVVHRFLLLAGSAGRPAGVALLTAGALCLEPVWSNLSFAQVNLFLLALLVTDLMNPDRRRAGVLVGIAAGLKLTPLLFVVHLVLIGKPRAAATAVGAFLGTIGVGFLLAPEASGAYWTRILWDAGRVGGVAYSGNQSMMGGLFRQLGHPPTTLFWFLVAGTAASAILLVGALAWRRGRPALSVCLAGLAMLVASPISWDHHWVWAVPLVLALWPLSRLCSLLTAAVFASGMIWWPPKRDLLELTWTPLEQLAGNAYLLLALALPAYLVVVLVRKRAPETLAR